MTKKITIITPSYNQGNYIEETIDSILSQSYNNFEYIIIDGGSTDNTLEVIKKYEKHLHFWLSEKDNGQSHAINKGLAKCTGDIFNWINSDDYLQPGALKKINDSFQDPKVNVHIGRSNIIRESEIIRRSRGTDVYQGNLAKTLGLARIDQPEHWWRKSIINNIGYLNEDLHFIMDRDWWIKYLLRFGLEGIAKSDSILVNFRLHAGSKTVSENESFNIERDSYFAALAKNYCINYKTQSLHWQPELIKNFPSEINNSLLEQALEYHYLVQADEFYVKNDFKATREILEYINKSVLDSESLKLYRNLKFRSQFPSGLVNFVRKNKF